MTTETRLHLSAVPTLQTYEFKVNEIENTVPTGTTYRATVVRYANHIGCTVIVEETKGKTAGRHREYYYERASSSWKAMEALVIQAVETLRKWGRK